LVILSYGFIAELGGIEVACFVRLDYNDWTFNYYEHLDPLRSKVSRRAEFLTICLRQTIKYLITDHPDLSCFSLQPIFPYYNLNSTTVLVISAFLAIFH